MLEAIIRSAQALLIVVENVKGKALPTLVMNRQRTGFGGLTFARRP
jgi:chaperonin GroEL (HSP60 family)